MAEPITIPRDWVRVAGPDAATFLQGQLSQDVARLVPGGPSTFSLLLQPTGKIDAWLGVTRLDDETFLLDTDPGAGDAVVARLARFKLRTKADIEPATGWRCWAPADDLRTRHVEPADDAVESGADGERYAVARVEQGLPAVGAELTGDTIPAEAGQWLIDASVSFTKGCYTGQELVARVDSRGGNVPRHLRGLRIDVDADADADADDAGGAADLPAPGAAILVGEQVVGHVTTAVRSSRFGAIALAVVHRSVEPPATVSVEGRSATVVELPFS